MKVERLSRSRPWRQEKLPLLSILLVLSLAWSQGGEAAPLRVVEDVRYHSAPGSTRVVIELDRGGDYKVGRLRQPARLYVDLLHARLPRDWGHRSVAIGDGRVRRLRIAQYQRDQVRVVLDLQGKNAYRVFTLTQPYRVVIDLSAPNGHRPDVPRRTIVIDPGHGGKDPGAIGPGGLEEKTVVLAVAKALRRLIEEAMPNTRVILTRERDVYVPLEERARIANAHQADLFVSIHVNASDSGEARGIETWYLSFAANERAKRIAARENRLAQTSLSELEIILRDLRETDRINRSALLAGMTHTALLNHLGRHYSGIVDRGVDGAPFVVLLHTAMPSILVELSFISHPQEARRLRSPSYQRALAEGIFHGLQRYLQTAVALAP
ncbi:MAG: N-acetylmuramoyl-L-alanine amidase [Candidatus Tectimicrobiota bacterium]|nr:MAG: N-acetylmuramoyl-L-alanine amidase [Candidatus Tectomicrobia bacterium]